MVGVDVSRFILNVRGGVDKALRSSLFLISYFNHPTTWISNPNFHRSRTREDSKQR